MSRSYKKTPSACYKSKFAKVQANRRLRRKRIVDDDDFPRRGNEYRKHYEQWDIMDDRDVCPSFEVFYRRQVARWHEWHQFSRRGRYDYPTREEEWKNYVKWYKRK